MHVVDFATPYSQDDEADSDHNISHDGRRTMRSNFIHQAGAFERQCATACDRSFHCLSALIHHLDSNRCESGIRRTDVENVVLPALAPFIHVVGGGVASAPSLREHKAVYPRHRTDKVWTAGRPVTLSDLASNTELTCWSVENDWTLVQSLSGANSRATPPTSTGKPEGPRSSVDVMTDSSSTSTGTGISRSIRCRGRADQHLPSATLGTREFTTVGSLIQHAESGACCHGDQILRHVRRLLGISSRCRIVCGRDANKLRKVGTTTGDLGDCGDDHQSMVLPGKGIHPRNAS